MLNISSFLYLIFIVATATTLCIAGITVGAAYTLVAFLFGSDNIKSRETYYNQNNRYNNKIFHKSGSLNYFVTKVLPFKAYSVSIFLSVLRISITTIATITAMATRPQTAAKILSDAGAVISVPMVYTKYATV